MAYVRKFRANVGKFRGEYQFEGLVRRKLAPVGPGRSVAREAQHGQGFLSGISPPILLQNTLH